MVMRFTCEQCGNELEVPAASVGRKAKCPACSHVMRVPAPAAPRPSATQSNPPHVADDLGPAEGTADQTAPEPVNQPLDKSSTSHQTGGDDRVLATLAHASGLIGVFTVGLLGFLGPLVIFVCCRDTSAFVGNQAKEALNFQISLSLMSLAISGIVLLSCGVVFPLLFIVPLMQVVFGIIAPLQVWSGNSYRYPMTLRLIK